MNMTMLRLAVQGCGAAPAGLILAGAAAALCTAAAVLLCGKCGRAARHGEYDENNKNKKRKH